MSTKTLPHDGHSFTFAQNLGGYYLRHRDAVDEYLRQQEEEAETFRREYEAQHPPTLTREVLLARLEARHDKG